MKNKEIFSLVSFISLIAIGYSSLAADNKLTGAATPTRNPLVLATGPTAISTANAPTTRPTIIAQGGVSGSSNPTATIGSTIGSGGSGGAIGSVSAVVPAGATVVINVVSPATAPTLASNNYNAGATDLLAATPLPK